MPSFLTKFFTTCSLLKLTGKSTNLSLSHLSISACKLAESNFGASLDVSILLAFLKSTFVV